MHEAEVVLKVALIAGNNPTVLAYGEQRNTQPRIINVDQNAAYSPAFEALQQDGALSPSCTLRPIAYSIISSSTITDSLKGVQDTAWGLALSVRLGGPLEALR